MPWLVGILLALAATLKAAELVLYPSVALTNDYSRYLIPLLIGAELGLAALTFSGLYWRQVRICLLLLFTGFAGYTLFLVVQGAESCGCFGAVEVNPWWTFLLDVGVLIGLVCEWRFARTQSETGVSQPTGVSPSFGLIGSAGMSLLVAAGLFWYVAPKQSTGDESFQVAGNLVILEPETWAGKEFPLKRYIDLDVSQGEWVVLLHRHDCHDCQEAAPKYDQLSQDSQALNVALIEIPPFGESHSPNFNHCQVGRLTDEREWFIQTPVEIQIKDGVVQSAELDLPSIQSDSSS